VWAFIERYKTLKRPCRGYLPGERALPAEEVWDRLPQQAQQRIIDLN